MSATAVPPGSRGAVDRIDEACAADLAPRDLLEVVMEQIRRVVPNDAYFVSATDPDTMLSIGAGWVHALPDATCDPFWEFEFEVPDFNKFTDLVRADRPAADLHAATGGRPERSPRWRELRTHAGFDAELRAVFTAGGRGWGQAHLNRAAEPFGEPEVAFVASIAPRVGRALRRAALTQVCETSSARGPGTAILDADHHLLSATPDALEWFDRMQTYRVRETGLGVRMPYEVVHAAQLARFGATVTDTPPLPTRTRVRTTCGAWVLIHASCLTDADGRLGNTAIVVERAKASDVAPLIVEAYELTPRELEVTRALARGLSTNEIAKELFLSRYTVQDHLKRIYDKVGVASRGELVARMFADHYHDRLELTKLGVA